MFGDREVGVVEEAAGEVGAARARELRRGHADLLLEQAAKMPGGQPQKSRRSASSLEVAKPVADDEPDAAADHLGSKAVDRRGRAVGPAPHAGTESRNLRRGCQVEVAHVRRLGTCRAPGPAVDAGRDHR